MWSSNPSVNFTSIIIFFFFFLWFLEVSGRSPQSSPTNHLQESHQFCQLSAWWNIAFFIIWGLGDLSSLNKVSPLHKSPSKCQNLQVSYYLAWVVNQSFRVTSSLASLWWTAQLVHSPSLSLPACLSISVGLPVRLSVGLTLQFSLPVHQPDQPVCLFDWPSISRPLIACQLWSTILSSYLLAKGRLVWTQSFQLEPYQWSTPILTTAPSTHAPLSPSQPVCLATKQLALREKGSLPTSDIWSAICVPDFHRQWSTVTPVTGQMSPRLTNRLLFLSDTNQRSYVSKLPLILFPGLGGLSRPFISVVAELWLCCLMTMLLYSGTDGGR